MGKELNGIGVVV